MFVDLFWPFILLIFLFTDRPFFPPMLSYSLLISIYLILPNTHPPSIPLTYIPHDSPSSLSPSFPPLPHYLSKYFRIADALVNDLVDEAAEEIDQFVDQYAEKFLNDI